MKLLASLRTITQGTLDNGKEFTDRFATGECKPTGNHLVDALCNKHGIEHRFIPPRKPQTNGMVEWFNGRVAKALNIYRFDSSDSLNETINNYVAVYNQAIPQRNLGRILPLQGYMYISGIKSS